MSGAGLVAPQETERSKLRRKYTKRSKKSDADVPKEKETEVEEQQMPSFAQEAEAIYERNIPRTRQWSSGSLERCVHDINAWLCHPHLKAVAEIWHDGIQQAIATIETASENETQLSPEVWQLIAYQVDAFMNSMRLLDDYEQLKQQSKEEVQRVWSAFREAQEANVNLQKENQGFRAGLRWTEAERDALQERLDKLEQENLKMRECLDDTPLAELAKPRRTRRKREQRQEETQPKETSAPPPSPEPKKPRHILHVDCEEEGKKPPSPEWTSSVVAAKH